MKRPSLVYAFFGAALAFAGCTAFTAPPSPEPIASEAPVQSAVVPKGTASAAPSASAPAAAAPAAAAAAAANAKLDMKDLVVGKGDEAKAGMNVSVHYVGTLLDGGKEFDSSRKRNKPFQFQLGAGKVIRGWDQGVAGMKVGGKRKLVIPPALAYGEGGSPPAIPPNASLVFEIELLGVTKQ